MNDELIYIHLKISRVEKSINIGLGVCCVVFFVVVVVVVVVVVAVVSNVSNVKSLKVSWTQEVPGYVLSGNVCYYYYLMKNIIVGNINVNQIPLIK